MKKGTYVLAASSPWSSRDPWAVGYYAGSTTSKSGLTWHQIANPKGEVFFDRKGSVRTISGEVGEWLIIHCKDLEYYNVNLLKAIKMAKNGEEFP